KSQLTALIENAYFKDRKARITTMINSMDSIKRTIETARRVLSHRYNNKEIEKVKRMLKKSKTYVANEKLDITYFHRLYDDVFSYCTVLKYWQPITEKFYYREQLPSVEQINSISPNYTYILSNMTDANKRPKKVESVFILPDIYNESCDEE
ncbi:MAG: hypothetical protein AAGA77_25915, partial [Bacteroidota bacterium]